LGNHCDFICNHIYDNGGAGILVETFTEDPSYSNHHTYIFGNILSDNGESGLRIKRSDNATIISNLMIHNGYTIEPVGALTFYGADSTLVLNNTFWDNAGPAIQIYNGSNQEITPITTNSLVANNISADDDGSVLFRVESNMINEPSNEFSHNLWYNGVPGSPIVSWGFDNVGAGNGMNLSFDQYLAIVSALNPNSGVGSMEADPLFSNPPDQIFDLSPGSPAFDAGALDLTSLGLEGLTANSDQSLDTGIPDLGYHHLPNVWISNPVIYNAVSMKIYPNPMNDKVRFEIELPSTNYPALPTIRIFNDLGQCVSRIRARDDSQNNTYNLVWEPDAYLASGLYFVYMNAAGFKSKARLILLK
jgi:parallel beta-helix repeat protein